MHGNVTGLKLENRARSPIYGSLIISPQGSVNQRLTNGAYKSIIIRQKVRCIIRTCYIGFEAGSNIRRFRQRIVYMNVTLRMYMSKAPFMQSLLVLLLNLVSSLPHPTPLVGMLVI